MERGGKSTLPNRPLTRYVSAESIGLVAVVVSVVLLALEVRQNTIAVETQAVFDMNVFSADMWLTFATEPELIEATAQAFDSPDTVPMDTMSRENFYRLSGFYNAGLVGNEAAWNFHRRDLISGEQYELYKRSFCIYLSNATYHAIFEQSRVHYNTDFINEFLQYCDEHPELSITADMVEEPTD